MEFLVVFLPSAVVVVVAWIALYLCDRQLVRLLRLRHAALFDSLRGRPRRWYDPAEEDWVQQTAVRRELRRLLAPLVAGDPELAAVLRRVDAAERWFRGALWVGAALAAVILLVLLVSRGR